MAGGIKRYTKPVFFPVYGILVGYIIMWIVKWSTGIIPYQYVVYKVGNHGFTMADIFLVTGAIVGGIIWYLKSKGNNQEDQ
jgi:hypothetical protein